MPYEYAYLIGDLILAIAWLYLYLSRKDLRHQQMLVSVGCAPLALSQYFFYQDYWRPEYLISFHLGQSVFGIEDFFFAFFIGGIGSVLYEVLFHKRHKCGKPRTKAAWFVVCMVAVLFCVFFKLGLVTIWANTLSLIIGATVMVLIDRDLRMDCVVSAACMFFFIVGLYEVWLWLFPDLIARFWVGSDLSGIGLLGIPIEELTWFTSWALFVSIGYEFRTNATRYSEIPKRKAGR